jgi:hypothetical protein
LPAATSTSSSVDHFLIEEDGRGGAGLAATATVAAVRQGGAMVNYQPVVEIDLTVMVAGGMPYPATVSQVVQQVHLARLQPGNALRVKVDPATIWIDFFAT